ncbi:MAG: hypothetical protein K8F26_12210, partial [Thiobacillus sp.]|nr:hypothetical protein [Thiobacillus sp.]
MKRAAWSIAAVLMVVAGLLAATWGLLNTASGFRWLVGTASTLSRGQLAVEGVTGHLGAPIGFQKLVVTTDTQRITLAGGQLEWQPRALLQRQLRIELLAVRQVRVEILKKDPTPPQLPDSLRLPVNVQVAAWDVAQLDVVEPGQTLSFKQLRGRVDDTGDRYTLAAAISTPWAEVDGQLGIQKDAPFDLLGRVAAARKLPLPVQATLELSGQLAAIRFRLDAQAEKMNVMAMGEIAPFAPVRLPRLLVSGHGIDPRQFAADAPQADLAFSGVFEGQPGERLLGTFSLANQQAGRLDQNRLPLASLTGAVLGDSAHADFSALTIDLGAAGQFAGEGQWRDGRFSVSLNSPSLNLAGMHRDLYPTRMRTTLQVSGDAAGQTLAADFAETWGEGRFVLSHAAAAVRLQEATFSGQVGKLTASGSVQLDASRAFAATFDATQINPARLGDFPRARLNAQGEVSGALLPELRLQAQFTLPPGELEGRPVKGQGRLRYANKHLSDTDIDIDLAGNRAQLKGAYGRAGDRLVWDINAPALARLNLGLAGRLTSSGSATGEPMQPQIDAQLEASGLRLPGEVAADSLSLQLRMQAAASGVFNGRLEARGIQVAGQRISVARASVQGRRNAHTLALDAKLPDWNVTASLAGGLEAPTTTLWRGQLNQAEVQGAWPMRLSAPAALVLGREQQQVSNLSLTLAGGKISAVHFSRQGAQLSTRGSLSNLPLAPLLGFLEQKPPFTTDLRMNGDWDLRMGNTVDGQARLVRQSGDVRLTDPALSLGLTTLGLDLSAEANRVTARLDVATREAGSAQAEGSATLLRVGDNFTLPRSAPLTWTGTLNVPDLRLAKAFLPVGVRLDARLAAQLAGSGSLA